MERKRKKRTWKKTFEECYLEGEVASSAAGEGVGHSEGSRPALAPGNALSGVKRRKMPSSKGSKCVSGCSCHIIVRMSLGSAGTVCGWNATKDQSFDE